MITYTYKDGTTKTYKHFNKYARWGATGMEIDKIDIDFENLRIKSKSELENLMSILLSINVAMTPFINVDFSEDRIKELKKYMLSDEEYKDLTRRTD